MNLVGGLGWPSRQQKSLTCWANPKNAYIFFQSSQHPGWVDGDFHHLPELQENPDLGKLNTYLIVNANLIRINYEGLLYSGYLTV